MVKNPQVLHIIPKKPSGVWSSDAGRRAVCGSAVDADHQQWTCTAKRQTFESRQTVRVVKSRSGRSWG